MKVLMVGDSPLMATGFGRVQSHALRAFLREGWEVRAVTGLQFEPKEPSEGLTKQYPVTRTDPQGLKVIAELIESKEYEPDVIYTTGEPGSVAALSTVLPARIPFFAYVPIEGEPILLPEWQSLLRTIQFMTCSEYGHQVAKRDLGRDIEYVYHGVDHDVFFPDEDRRQATREKLGWIDKFVVMTVAANVRRKQHPRLFEALAILKNQYKQRDIILYDHTVPFQHFILDGWNLPFVSAGFGVGDEVVFNPALSGFGAHVPDADSADIPSLADLYRAADLFVLPSQVEGFGLPIAEAMASGTPVVVTKYAAGWEVAKVGQGVGLPVHDWEIHKSGVRYANVNPQDIAKAILNLKRDPKQRARMSAAGIAGAQRFQWSEFEEKVVDAVKTANSLGGIPTPPTESETPDSGVQPAVTQAA